MMDRRRFLTAASAAPLAFSARVAGAAEPATAGQLQVGVAHRWNHPLTEWQMFCPRQSKEPVAFSLGDSSLEGAAELRLTVGMFDRGDHTLEIRIAKLEPVRHLLRNPASFEPVIIPLNPEQVAAAKEQGILVEHVEGEKDLWFFEDPTSDLGNASSFVPHLFQASAEAEPVAQCIEKLASWHGLNEFGWRNGCILDGLWMMGKHLDHAPSRAALEAQLEFYFDHQLAPPGKPVEWMPGMEGLLPWAPLARIQSEHKTVDLMLDHVSQHRREDGAICDGTRIVTETNYTVAYPLAVIGKARGDQSLIDDALLQLRLHVKHHATEDAVYLRRAQSGERSFRNWCRGIAWYFLGMVRTLEETGPDDELVQEVERCASWIVQLQNQDGLWHTFVDEPDTPTDTSGSSGIAAAMGAAMRLGWIDQGFEGAIDQAYHGVAEKLTADGWLTGIAPGNVGGEELQRHPYRSTQQMGMGLYAGLLAEIKVV